MIPGRIGRRLAVMAMLVASPVAARDAASVTLPMGTEIPLVTATTLSSKTSAKGDFVVLETAADVQVEDHLVIAAGTKVTGQVTDAQAKGALGMSGRLAIRPLYLRVGDVTVRLGGASSGKGSVTAGAVAGMVFLTPGFTGRSAVLPQGTPLSGFVERAIDLPVLARGL